MEQRSADRPLRGPSLAISRHRPEGAAQALHRRLPVALPDKPPDVFCRVGAIEETVWSSVRPIGRCEDRLWLSFGCLAKVKLLEQHGVTVAEVDMVPVLLVEGCTMRCMLCWMGFARGRSFLARRRGDRGWCGGGR